MLRIHLGLFPAFLTTPTSIVSQDTSAARSQAELVREADSVRATYADSLGPAEVPPDDSPAPNPVAASPTEPSPPSQPSPPVSDKPSADQIARAIAQGQNANDFQGIHGGSTTFDEARPRLRCHADRALDSGQTLIVDGGISC